MNTRLNRLFASAFLSMAICFGLLVTAGSSYAAAPAQKQVPTNIKSAQMEYDADRQVVIFTGKVYVKRPDFELWSEKMTVYLDKTASSQNGQQNSSEVGGMQAGDIDRIVAEKNVRMKSEDKDGTCNKATYYAKEDKFVMEGSPVLRDSKQSTVTGGTVVHYLSRNHSEVLNGADVTFYAPDNTTKKNP